MQPQLLQTVRKRLDDAFLFDYNLIIEEFQIYQKLSSKLKTQVVSSVFGGFIKNFHLFFGELEYGFVSELVMNLFARSFNPGEVLLAAGQAVTKLMFITRGNFAICDPTSKYDPFLILPENSFYGDF